MFYTILILCFNSNVNNKTLDQNGMKRQIKMV